MNSLLSSVLERSLFQKSSESKLNSDSSDKKEMILKPILHVLVPKYIGTISLFSIFSSKYRELTDMVGEMVQNSKSLYSFTFNAVIVIHEYIYSRSTTKFTLKKYIYSHLMMYFLFTNIFTHIYEIYSFTFNGLYSFTFTIEIFIHHFLRTAFAHH